MKTQWMTAALLGSALVVGCSGPGNDDTRNLDENGAPVAAGSVTDQQVQPAAPAPAERPDASGARPTTGNRTARAPRTSAPARPAVAPRNEEPEPRRVEAAPARPVVRYATIPAGTSLPLELTTAVSTETAQVETPVSARLRQDVVVNGVTLLPAGSVVGGEVVEVERAGRVKGRARLALRFTSVTIGDTREDLRTNPVSFQGEATRGEDATKIGAGAGIGAVIGGIVGGGDGAAKGAAIGGAAGTGTVLATRGREVALPAGTDLNATLTSEIDVRVR